MHQYPVGMFIATRHRKSGGIARIGNPFLDVVERTKQDDLLGHFPAPGASGIDMRGAMPMTDLR